MGAGSTGSASRLVPFVLICSLAGCGDSGRDETDEDNPVITLKEESNSWPDAEIRGALSKREGCLLIGDSVAVFPFGTTWRSPDVVFGDGTSVSVGTEVSLGGGSFDAVDVTAEDLPIVPIDRVKACAERTGVTSFVWAAP